MARVGFVAFFAMCLLGCDQDAGDAVQSAASSVQCSEPIPGWRNPGELGHHEVVVFITADAGGRLLSTFDVGGRKSTERLIQASERAWFFEELSSFRPEPLVVLHPSPEASCATINNIRQQMSSNLDCNSGRCGEGAGWTYFGTAEAAD